MRLRINLEKNNLQLPLSYQPIIQGLIYGMLPKKEIGDFYHNQGYEFNSKRFKLFVFSNLFGNYKIKGKQIVFADKVSFDFATIDNNVSRYVYNYLIKNKQIVINNQIVEIKGIEIMECNYFKNNRKIIIKTISPIVAYKTKDNFTKYFKPTDKEFYDLVRVNLEEKAKAYDSNEKIIFLINNVISEKKRMVKFKNTILEAYDAKLEVEVNYSAYKYMLESGLSSKGSAGFGMVKTTR